MMEKTENKIKRSVHKPKIRWQLLGLPEPNFSLFFNRNNSAGSVSIGMELGRTRAYEPQPTKQVFGEEAVRRTCATYTIMWRLTKIHKE